jgi:hypothetical protein
MVEVLKGSKYAVLIEYVSSDMQMIRMRRKEEPLSVLWGPRL